MLINRIMRIFEQGETRDRPLTDSAGAVVNEASIFIAAPPDAVYRLLDPAGDAHRWGLRGDRIDAVDRARGLFRLTDQRMPAEPLLIQIDMSAPPAVVSMTVHGDGGRPFGAVWKSSSRYEIAAAPGGSGVTLIERTQFLDGLGARDLKLHARLMGEGVRKDLERLKNEAEGAG